MNFYLFKDKGLSEIRPYPVYISVFFAESKDEAENIIYDNSSVAIGPLEYIDTFETQEQLIEAVRDAGGIVYRANQEDLNSKPLITFSFTEKEAQLIASALQFLKDNPTAQNLAACIADIKHYDKRRFRIF